LPTEVAGITTLEEFDENYRFFTSSSDPNMDPTVRLFFKPDFSPKKQNKKDGFCLKNKNKARHDTCNIFKFKLVSELFWNFSDKYMVTQVEIRVKTWPFSTYFQNKIT
jgi:hypothetical protein